MDNQLDLWGKSPEELAALMKTVFGHPAFRGRQIAEWLYKRGARSFADMTNLPQGLREQLAVVATATFAIPTALADLISADRKTKKALLQLADGATIETVLMRQPYGNSVCVSSQVGCAMGCAFCASTKNGCERNLTRGEMLRQVFHFHCPQDKAAQVSRVVIMGSGEPLLNYEEVLAFIRLLHESQVLGISYRHITLSTCGLVEGIDRLASEGLPINLAISLHAANDVTRSRLMPVNKRYPIADVVAAAGRYAMKTGRRVTYEYTLIEGVNSSRNDVAELARLVAGQLAHVNLIPVNPIKEKGFFPPSPSGVQAFLDYLEKHGVPVSLRKTMGDDIAAACGQLRARQQENADGTL